MKNTIALSILSLLLSACGGGGSTSNNNPQTPPQSDLPVYNSMFPESTIWSEKVKYRRFDNKDKSDVETVLYANDDKVCYLLRDISLQDETIFDSNWNNVVQCVDLDGNIVFEYQKQAQGIIKDLIIIPNNEIVIAELINANIEGDARKFFLQLSRYSSNGQLIDQRQLTDAASQEELYHYDNRDTEMKRKVFTDLVHGDKPVLADSSIVKLKWTTNGIYLLAYTYGVKVYNLSDNLDTKWDVQVMPAYTWLWTRMLQNEADFTVGNNNQLFVAFELFEDDNEIYEAHFGRALEKNNDLADNAISVFDENGNFQRSHVLAHDDYSEDLTGIIFHDNHLWIGGNVRHNKFNRPNDTTEYDFLLQQVSPEDGSTVSYKLINFDNEDYSYDFTLSPKGNFIFSGITGFIQVDTNSQVSYGKGLMLEISKAGEVLRSMQLNGPRNVYLKSAYPIDDNHLVFSSVYDGPITHTCDHDDSLCYQKSVVGLADLSTNNAE